MDYCLVCDEQLIVQINWENVIHLKKRPKLCERCASQLEELSGKQCRTCSRQTVYEQCTDCQKWAKIYANEDPLIKNVSLYAYNENMKDIISKWKYRGDYILGEIFQDAFHFHFNKQFAQVKKEAIITPIPLSDERLFERSFNQAYMLATFVCDNAELLIERVHNEKQSKKSRLERMMTVNPFRAKRRITRPVILIDDIYTTGRTIRHAANELKDNGCPHVYSYTLIRG